MEKRKKLTDQDSCKPVFHLIFKAISMMRLTRNSAHASDLIDMISRRIGIRKPDYLKFALILLDCFSGIYILPFNKREQLRLLVTTVETVNLATVLRW